MVGFQTRGPILTSSVAIPPTRAGHTSPSTSAANRRQVLPVMDDITRCKRHGMRQDRPLCSRSRPGFRFCQIASWPYLPVHEQPDASLFNLMAHRLWVSARNRASWSNALAQSHWRPAFFCLGLQIAAGSRSRDRGPPRRDHHVFLGDVAPAFANAITSSISWCNPLAWGG